MDKSKSNNYGSPEGEKIPFSDPFLTFDLNCFQLAKTFFSNFFTNKIVEKNIQNNKPCKTSPCLFL